MILTQKEQNTWMGQQVYWLALSCLHFFLLLYLANAQKFEQDIKAGLALMIGVMILFGFLPYEAWYFTHCDVMCSCFGMS